MMDEIMNEQIKKLSEEIGVYERTIQNAQDALDAAERELDEYLGKAYADSNDDPER